MGDLKDISKVVNSSADCNFTQLVSGHDGSTIVHTYNWIDFFRTNLRKVKGIEKFHHFNMKASIPGSVFVREQIDTAEFEMHHGSHTKMNFHKSFLPAA